MEFGERESGVACQLFETPIEVVHRSFRCQGHHVKVLQQFECCTGSDGELRGRINSATKELKVIRNGTGTAAVLNRD